MSEKKFERFGRYLILDHLVDGGMAKICRARFLGEQANKVVAIKMVQPQFSKDPSFVQMFEDELNVTFGLLHPNIAQTYDYGIVNEQLFTAMEYVDGANLKQYLDRLKEKHFVFPVEISTYIISQVCQALHYAHTFTDKLTGKPFNIIHRDISPHNIMLSYDGAVKVIDFGIAKADSNSESTQAGTIKGKLSYLAPEYLEGLDLDPRYDLFAVGITLWELLCSRKLFQASNDLAVLKQIQACKIPAPSSINPNVPKELDEIVLKACAKDRNARYEDMDKFNRALVKFLYSKYPDFNPSDLGYFAKQLFKEEIAEDKKKMVEYGKIDIAPYLEDMKNDGASAPQASEVGETPLKFTKTKKIEIDFGSLEDSKEGTANISLETSQVGTKAQNTQSRKITPVQRQTSSRRAQVKSSQTTKSRNIKQVKQEESHSGSPKIIIIVIAATLVFAYFNPELIKEYTGFDFFGASSSATREISSEKQGATRSEPRGELGIISLVGYDSSMIVQVNNKQIAVRGINIEVPLNQNLEIVVSKSGHKSFIQSQVRLNKDNNRKNIIVPVLERERIGYLSTTLNFPSGSQLVFKIDGREIRKDLPFKNERIPAGEYEGTIVNNLLGTEKSVQFEIEENKKQFLDN